MLYCTRKRKDCGAACHTAFCRQHFPNARITRPARDERHRVIDIMRMFSCMGVAYARESSHFPKRPYGTDNTPETGAGVATEELPRAALKRRFLPKKEVSSWSCNRGIAACGIETQWSISSSAILCVATEELPRAALKHHRGNLRASTPQLQQRNCRVRH